MDCAAPLLSLAIIVDDDPHAVFVPTTGHVAPSVERALAPIAYRTR
jgi:hypothetical protein